MKKWTLLALIASTSLLIYGCSKSNAGSATTTGSSSEWTLGGTTYKGVSTRYDDTTSGLGVLVSAAVGGNLISVIFYSHPAANGTYVVTNGGIPAAGAYCLIQVYTYIGTTATLYTSTGKTGDKVNLTISAGKITVSFTNITVSVGSTTSTVSGTVVQQ